MKVYFSIYPHNLPWNISRQTSFYVEDSIGFKKTHSGKKIVGRETKTTYWKILFLEKWRTCENLIFKNLYQFDFKHILKHWKISIYYCNLFCLIKCVSWLCLNEVESFSLTPLVCFYCNFDKKLKLEFAIAILVEKKIPMFKKSNGEYF